MDQKAQKQGRFRRLAPGLVTATLIAGAAGLGCSASDGQPEGSWSQAIAGGVADVSHRSVFLLVVHHDNFSSTCTATLLAPNLLLTARHCVSPGSHEDVLCGDAVLGQPYPADRFYATNDPRPRDGSPVFTAVDIKVPIEGGDTCGFDIALIVLGQNVPADLAQPAVPRIDQEVQPGELYTAVGYGEDETGQSTGTRMERSGLSIDCQPGSCGSGVESTEFRGEEGICSGDSGGPALDAAGKVVGVVSRGGADCGTPIYGTVTAWRDFLMETAQEAADLGGYEPAFWVTTGSSNPPVLSDPGAGAGGATPQEPGAAEGEPCADSPCGEGLACYTASGDPSAATCVTQCTATSECKDGLACENVGATSICIAPSGRGPDDGGCSLAPHPIGGRGALSWLVFGFLALLARKARR